MDTLPFQFIDQPVEVVYDSPPVLEKIPACPQGFIWKANLYRIQSVLAEWQDFHRRGRMARNMQPGHASRAERVGSWGVGRYYFRVLVGSGQIFEIYYDRAPADAGDRKGTWFLLGERRPV